MKTPTKSEELLTEVLGGEDSLRTVTLEAGLTSLRRRRRFRRVRTTTFVLIPFAALAVLLIQRLPSSRSNSPQQFYVTAPANIIEGTAINVLTDEQLLALFKDRPVALVGPPEDRKLVLFDEL